MALNEPILDGSTLLVVGQLVVIDGTHKVVINPTSQTVATLSASLPGSPVIRQCDYASRYGGVFLAAGQGGKGTTIED
jgi:hypothetical protein